MSEVAGSAPNAGGSQASSPSADNANVAGHGQSQKTSQAVPPGRQGASQGAPSPKGNGQESQARKVSPEAREGAKAAPSEDDDYEEVRVGSTSARVPKAFAKTIKGLEQGFQKVSQENASHRQLAQLAQAAKDNPEVADMLMEKLGIDADSYSQQRLAKRLEREMMTEEQRRATDAEKKLAEYEKKEREAQEREQHEKLTKAEKEHDGKLRNEIFTAWKDSGLPAEPEFGAWMAAEMARADAQGVELTAGEAASRVKDKFDALIKQTVKSLTAEQLETYLGHEPLNKWREFEVQRVTGKSASQTKRPGGSSSASEREQQPKSGGPKKALSEQEYRDYFANLARQN
jgi:hypothetical protein